MYFVHLMTKRHSAELSSVSKILSINSSNCVMVSSEPRHDKTNKMAMRPAKTQISLGIRQSDQSLRCPHEESLSP